jgi:hypothetical protein
VFFLRQSTAVDVAIGPFLDATDGVTAETGLTISQADVRLKKNNGAWAQVNDATSATHEEAGWYEKELDATDTNTVGSLIISIQESGALPVWHEFQVVEEAVYDMLFAGSALGYIANAPVNVAQISGDSTAADNLETAFDDTAGAVAWNGIIDQGTAQSATGTTLVLRSAASFADDTPIGATLMVHGSTQGYWQTRTITDYVSATDTATVEAWTVTPSGTITYKIFATAPSAGGGGLDAAGVRSAIGLASANLDTQLSGLDTKLDTIDNFVDTEVAAIQTSLTTIDGKIDTVDNFLDTEVAAILAAVDTEIGALQTSVNTIDDFLDTEIAALTTNLATANTNINTIDDLLDTEVAAIKTVVDAVKVKTDSLTFTVAGVVDANIQRINDVALTGDGSGTPFTVA